MHEHNPAPPTEQSWPDPAPAVSRTGPARGALIGQAAIVLVGVYVVATSLGLQLWDDLGPGPGFLPFVLGVALLLLAVSWFLQEITRAARAAAPASATSTQGAAEAAEDAPAGGTGGGFADWGHLAAIVGSLVVLGLVIDLVGFQLSMFAFLMFHLKRGGEVRWLTAVIIALVGSVGTFVLFGAGLGVQLPAAGISFLADLGL